MPLRLQGTLKPEPKTPSIWRGLDLRLFAQFQYQGILAYLRNVSMPQPAMWIAGD